MGFVKVLGYNDCGDDIVAASGRISTTEGKATEIFEKSKGNEKNLNLINKVISSGHITILEHLHFNLAFEDVSVYVEQFLINFRLSSFTIKSRRYVDFTNAGYYRPSFIQRAKLGKLYDEYTKKRFDFYTEMVKGGIPKEDARFVLPYNFHSNIFLSLDASELLHMMHEMTNGDGRTFDELQDLFMQLQDQLVEKFPYMKVKHEPYSGCRDFSIITWIKEMDRKMIDNSGRGDKLITLNKDVPGSKLVNDVLKYHLLKQGICNTQTITAIPSDTKKEMLHYIFNDNRSKELEAAVFDVTFNSLSLAAITHLTRHRMQSVVIPDLIEAARYDCYVIPDSIKGTNFESRYKLLFEEAVEEIDEMCRYQLGRHERGYLLMAGLTYPVKTKINARSLDHFFKLRCCNRAQWEIKNAANALRKEVNDYCPEFAGFFGPSCYRLDYCPEGRMCCGHFDDIKNEYK